MYPNTEKMGRELGECCSYSSCGGRHKHNQWYCFDNLHYEKDCSAALHKFVWVNGASSSGALEINTGTSGQLVTTSRSWALISLWTYLG